MEIDNLSSSSSFWLFLWFSVLFLAPNAEVHQHDFVIKAVPVKRLCHTRSTITVNGQFPGPTLLVRNGDSLVIRVVNQAKYNITLHWHGIRQLRNGWADGPAYVTQCPIQAGGSYTYRFSVEDQEGTLWWHAHNSWLRATVHGALIILPKLHCSYPFAPPKCEWWNANPLDIIRRALKTGAAPQPSDSLTINGQPGDLYKCSTKETTVIPVAAGETILLRFINAAMLTELFVSVADHNMTVVAADSSYTKPFTTSVVLIAPGQTTDVLIHANRPAGRYYIAARAYQSGSLNTPFDNTTTTAILIYENQTPGHSPPKLPVLPPYNDTAAVAAFSAGIKGLYAVKIPAPVDEHLFFTVGLGLISCQQGKTCSGPNGTLFTTSMNNYSFVLPKGLSLLQAAQSGVRGVFTTDFPASPPVKFDYTGDNISTSLYQPVRATKLYPLKYGSVVQLVMQGTNIYMSEEHPMHIHGYEFLVLATGRGNFDAKRDAAKFNLVDPPRRNTVGVPVKGWGVIRFVADNPGVWFVHCHIDSHLSWGLAMAFLVENGAGELQSTAPPPLDLPKC
ncbi:laccase-3-like isoform X2 [Phalaenopsis equestris]|uniref:laccase-3-like isoform X2 n=1 Tax=Phalaenopsis equestris TaxID=78828 RepID=UPI0009E6354A|nr:laccase-3-like isoform X2 [Phalaenopsis equestris]